MMLMYHDKESDSYQLVQNMFDKHFKLTLTVHGKYLPAGEYALMIAP